MLATKAELKEEEGKIVKLQAFYSNYFRGKCHFEDDGTQNYLAFHSVSRYFKTVANTSKVTALKSKGLSHESTKPPSTSDYSLKPGINYFDNSKIRRKFGGFLTNELQFASYELQVAIYCTSYELLFTYELRVITYRMSYELIFEYELRVTI